MCYRLRPDGRIPNPGRSAQHPAEGDVMPAPSPYNDADYRAAKRWLKAHPDTECWFHDCTEPATTIDHVPAISEHHHQRGANCCQLKPACRPHNCSHGATIGNQARNADRDADLTASAQRWRGIGVNR